MFQRMQSIVLAIVVFLMGYFLVVPMWTIYSLDNNVHFVVNSYALIATTGLKIFFPYILAAILACFILLFTIYVMMQHHNLRFQKKLALFIVPLSTALQLSTFIIFTKSKDGLHSILIHPPVTQSGALVPLLAIIAACIAVFFIHKDLELIYDDSLR